MALLDLPKFLGEVVRPGDSDYEDKRTQYATTSEPAAAMSPGAIIYPSPTNPDADVITAIKYAASKGIAIAVRTGGHQYSGSSSTSANNIQLDLSDAYRNFKWDDTTGLLEMGISYSLGQLDTALGALHLFVPHGQCTHVHVGGHAHTGGYGLPGRAYGLFADHIMAIRVITADGEIRNIRRDAVGPDADLFYGVLGGSPGNFGILTEITLKPHRDADHPNSRGYKAITFYRTSAFKQLLDIKARMAADQTLPADFDLCITVITRGNQVLDSYGFSDADFEKNTEDAKKEKAKSDEESRIRPQARGISDLIPHEKWDFNTVIIVWASWSNVEGPGYEMDDISAQYFKDLEHAMWWQVPLVGGFPLQEKPMSTLTAAWVFDIQREFSFPFIKRTFVAHDGVDLQTNKWPEVTIHQVEAMIDRHPDVSIAVQIQHYGGNSTYRKNDPENKTSYSWRRDGTVSHVMDGFYDPQGSTKNGLTPQQFVQKWQTDNDRLFAAAGTGVMGGDRRVLWGSYSVTDAEKYLGVSWPFYYENDAKYNRLVAIKNHYDPSGVFTPNGFCVGQSPPTL